MPIETTAADDTVDTRSSVVAKLRMSVPFERHVSAMALPTCMDAMTGLLYFLWKSLATRDIPRTVVIQDIV